MKRFACLLGVIAFAGQAGAQTALSTTNSTATITLGATFQTVLAALGAPPATRHSLLIQNNNTSGDACYVYVGSGTATAATSILLSQGMSYSRYYPYVPSDPIQATCATTNDTLYIETQ